MPDLAGTWKIYRVKAKTANVAKDATDLVISSTNNDFTFTLDGGSQGVTQTPTSYTRTANSYSGKNATYELNVRTVVTGTDEVLVGYIKNITTGAVDALGTLKTNPGTPPNIDDARYKIQAFTHSGTGVVLNEANLLITRLKGVRFIVLFLKDGQPIALKPGSSSTPTFITAQGSYNNSKLKLEIRSIPTPQGATAQHLSGHITWEGGLGGSLADEGHGLGTDDADSFVAVRAGSSPIPCDETMDQIKMTE